MVLSFPVDRILPQRGWSTFPTGAEAGFQGGGGANNSKMMQMKTNIFLFKQITELKMRPAGIIMEPQRDKIKKDVISFFFSSGLPG